MIGLWIQKAQTPLSVKYLGIALKDQYRKQVFTCKYWADVEDFLSLLKKKKPFIVELLNTILLTNGINFFVMNIPLFIFITKK